MKSISILLRRWRARLAPDRCPGVSPGAVCLILKNKKIEPQMKRTNADGQIENPIFIRVLHLRSSRSSAVKKLKLALGVSLGRVKCKSRDASATSWRQTRQPLACLRLFTNLHARLHDIFTQAAGSLLLAFIAPTIVHANSRNFSMPSYLANPGGILEVPLSLDNAAGLAAIQVQVNFDPEVLELQTVTAGPLGAAFELSQGNGDGFVQLTFFRSEALAGGAGRLAALKFRANPGAETSLFSELAIADLSLSDSTGVIDLRQKDTLVTTNGQVAVTVQQNIDNARNGLPDWWEMQHGLNLFTANSNLDPEHDGLTNLLEYALGGNPTIADAHERGVQPGRLESIGETFLSVGFHRRLGDASLLVSVQESANLGIWNNLNLSQQLIGTPQNMGDGTEFVNVLGTIPVTGANAQPRGFLRVVAERQ